MPVSATSITATSPNRTAESDTLPPGGVNLSAFESRLSTTWPSRSGSAEARRPRSQRTETSISFATAARAGGRRGLLDDLFQRDLATLER